MKRPVILILVVGLALAGCSKGGSSSSPDQSTAPAQTSASQAAASQATEVPVTTDIPVYPGATKNAMVGSMTMNRCGHKMSIATYDVSGNDAAAVTEWYADRIPGGIRLTKDTSMGGGVSMAMTEIVEPAGGRIATVTLTSAPASLHVPGGALHVSLANIDPAFSPEELQTMQAAMGSDPAAKQQAIAKMKAKCGPDSVKGL